MQSDPVRRRCWPSRRPCRSSSSAICVRKRESYASLFWNTSQEPNQSSHSFCEFTFPYHAPYAFASLPTAYGLLASSTSLAPACRKHSCAAAFAAACAAACRTRPPRLLRPLSPCHVPTRIQPCIYSMHTQKDDVDYCIALMNSSTPIPLIRGQSISCRGSNTKLDRSFPKRHP